MHEVGYARWVSCEAGYARWITRGGLCKVSYARWVSREVDYTRYESPSEMFHSLIFLFFNATAKLEYKIFKVTAFW